MKVNPEKIFSALNDKLQTCCHPEFQLNKRYQNEFEELYGKLLDKFSPEFDPILVILKNVPKSLEITWGCLS